MQFPQHAVEEEVGISEHLGPGVPGFSGQFKSRWQDFHVHEVDLAGIELHLTELITPGAVAAELKKEAEERREARNALGPSFFFDSTTEAAVHDAIGQKYSQELLGFLQEQAPPKKETPPELPEEPPEKAERRDFLDLIAAEVKDGSKEARKKAHEVILKHFGSFLNTETVEAKPGEGEAGTRVIRIWMREAEKKVKTSMGKAAPEEGKGTRKGKNKSKGKGQKGKGDKGVKTPDAGGDFGALRREGWPKDRPEYLYFRLYKENCDTGEAVSGIARCVGRSAKQFTFAGTKDRRAVTVQQICAHRLPADQLRRTVLHRGWDKRVRISDLEYRADRLRLGQLSGNRFKILLREVPVDALAGSGPADQVSESTVSRAFEAVRTGGFLNYFGLQRFGTRQVKTHQVGAAIIARKWEEAVHLILGGAKRPAEVEAASDRPCKLPRKGDEDEGDQPQVKAVKGRGKGDAQKLVSEAQRVYLDTGDAQRALELMPRSHSLERCLLGARARALTNQEALQQLPHQALSLYAHAAQSVIWNAVLSRRLRHFGRSPVAGDLVLLAAQEWTVDQVLEGVEAEGDEPDETPTADGRCGTALPPVRILTEEEAKTVRLQDVVLPLPGFEVVYPSHLRDAYEELSQRLLGLSLADFSECTMVRLSGSYRTAAACPQDLQWHALSPESLQSTPALMETDVARLLSEREHNPQLENRSEKSQAEYSEGKGTGAVAFSCILPPSSYLTMMLRELMKTGV
ncbi:Multisubstrate pseudouridine synthase 7 (RNA pseudouridylate synthase 7) (RNA-uridine isomerase 7) [Durusdinium trenchii]|uniref:Multisubstrate pseudouridine synthase 7 (RNA pseudouridylate synthase 7) (RNA-uridine isomerase 7) n=1 Tax=Durusdinium trenchii TaxID=1381693 RepID=A0ABP0I909_9DINO